jgi:hypothetical protein
MKELNRATFLDLVEQIEHGDPQSKMNAAREMASRNNGAYVRDLIDILKNTDDKVIRNSLAMTVGDLKIPLAFDVLVDLLRSDRTKGSRGTILYSISSYDYSQILPLLVDFVITEPFEVSHQALALISGMEAEVDEHIWHKCIGELRSALITSTIDRGHLIREAISIFEQAR